MSVVRDPLSLLRDEVAGSFAALLRPKDGGRSLERWVSAEGDAGLFGPESPAWRVHGDIATLVGGLRALLLQTLHPLTMAGVADHSRFREDPFGRLNRTAGFLAGTIFGSTTDAERAIAEVRRVHQHVRGTTPGGRPYSATDPHLVTFVHVTEVDSFLESHQAFGPGRLSPADADRYVADMAQVCLLLGGDEPPTTAAGLRTWLDDVRPELRYGRQARGAVRFILRPPLPLQARPAYGVTVAASVGLLPLWAQRMLLLPAVPPVDLLAVRPAVRSMLLTLRWAVGTSPARDRALARVASAG